jgi:hypothetical protein
MMPTGSNSFQLHELIDLPLSFLYYGPPCFVSELPGEQMMKQIKNWKLKSNMGGNLLSFLYSVMRKQIYFEKWKMRTSYARIPSKDDSHFTRRPHTKQLIYNEFPFELHNPEKQIKKTQLNRFELEHLCRTLYAEVIRNFGGKNSECEESAIYRIFNNTNVSYLSQMYRFKYSSQIRTSAVAHLPKIVSFIPFLLRFLVHHAHLHLKASFLSSRYTV